MAILSHITWILEKPPRLICLEDLKSQLGTQVEKLRNIYLSSQALHNREYAYSSWNGYQVSQPFGMLWIVHCCSTHFSERNKSSLLTEDLTNDSSPCWENSEGVENEDRTGICYTNACVTTHLTFEPWLY